VRVSRISRRVGIADTCTRNVISHGLWTGSVFGRTRHPVPALNSGFELAIGQFVLRLSYWTKVQYTRATASVYFNHQSSPRVIRNVWNFQIAMSKTKQKAQPSAHRQAKPGGRRQLIIALIVVVLGVGFAAVLLLQEKRIDYQTLQGRWLRPDGGYVLEIRAVDPSGAITAAYLNPRPINIAKAEATRDGSTMKVFLELRAPNYPGSRYTLAYDPKRDQLQGTYFQAVERQNFNVVFVRMK